MRELWDETVEELASKFSLDICRVWNEHHGYRGWPPEHSYEQAKLALETLGKRVGDDNLKKIIARWEEALIPGLDY